MLDVQNEDYVRTARAKGMLASRRGRRHIFRNAMLPIVTIIGLQTGLLLSGAVLTETVFAWPGMGTWLVRGDQAPQLPRAPGRDPVRLARLRARQPARGRLVRAHQPADPGLLMSVAEAEAREVQLEAPSGLWRDAWRRLRRNPGAIVGFVLVGLFVFVAIFAPLIAPEDPDGGQNARPAAGEPAARARRADHCSASTQQGRDVFSRVVYGARYSLLIGVVSVAVGPLDRARCSARSPATSAAGSTPSSCA